MPKLVLCAYWGPRRESLDDCADRLQRFGTCLVGWDAALAQWFRKGRSARKASREPIDLSDAATVRALLEAGRNRNDIGGEVIEALGFRVALWNGRTDTAGEAAFSLTCGLYAERVASNTLLVDLPQDLGRIAEEDAMAQALADVAAIWQPDWAGVVTKVAMRTRAFDATIPFVDRMLYLPRPVLALPAPIAVKEIAGGSIVVLPPESDSPEGTALVARVEDALGIARMPAAAG